MFQAQLNRTQSKSHLDPGARPSTSHQNQRKDDNEWKKRYSLPWYIKIPHFYNAPVITFMVNGVS